jgi:predicted nucleic acid-binding protein
VVTLDTNIAVYALAATPKADAAARALRRCSFLSVQVLNEYANVGRRKRGDAWEVIADDLSALREAVPLILPIADSANREATRIAARYQLSFYDALMLAVALEGGARTIYSEDMHHDLLIEDRLRIVDPFR